jgi:hypothetical protein
MQTDPNTAVAADPTPAASAPVLSQWTTMGVYRRRMAIVVIGILIVLVAFLGAALAERLGMGVDPFQVAWVTLSAEIVMAVYKWGVGGWSRYTPPDRSQLSSAGTPVATTLSGSAPPASSSSAPTDPRV